jgi:dTDP-glucose 4,6-dehydratase
MVRYDSMSRRGWLENSPSRSPIKFRHGDIRDAEFVRAAMRDVEVVFHLAALIAIPYSYEAPASYVETNIQGTLNVLQAARDLRTSRVVHTSTSEVYGTARYVPIDEVHPLQGQSPYSATKIGADKLVESFHLSFKLPVVTARPFNTFGPRQSARAIIPTVIMQALRGDRILLGNTTPTRDLNFVANTVDGFLACAGTEAAIGGTFNLGSGREISIGDLVELIVRRMGRAVTVQGDPQRERPAGSEVERLLADSRRAKEVLGWEPKVSLEEGIDRTIAWLAENRGLYRADEYIT